MSEEDERYVCTLTAQSLEKAQKELNENPKDRMSSVRALREWILQQPHLHVRTDTAYLLMFLRGAKFSQLRAREMIDGLMTHITSLPNWFRNIDTHEPRLLKALDTGFLLPLPKSDSQGRKILLNRLGQINPDSKEYDFSDRLRASIAISQLYQEDENIEVNGWLHVIDMTDVTMKHFMSSFSMDDRRKWMKVWQKHVPGRFKGFHMYNAGAVIDFIITMMKGVMSNKYQERLHVHDNLESIYEHVPMELWPEEYLPDDYTGPNAGTVKDILADLKRRVIDDKYRQKTLDDTGSQWGVDESKRPKTDIKHNSSYRKLTTD